MAVFLCKNMKTAQGMSPNYITSGVHHNTNYISFSVFALVDTQTYRNMQQLVIDAHKNNNCIASMAGVRESITGTTVLRSTMVESLIEVTDQICTFDRGVPVFNRLIRGEI